MIVITKLVSLTEFNKLRKDSSYTKLELRHNKNNTRDIRVDCYLCFDKDIHKAISIKNSFIHTLKIHSANQSLPKEIKEKFGGWYSDVVFHNGWIRMKDFKELLKVEKEYSLSLNIPTKFKKYENK